ncbi:Imm49 family immunity protein [Archangium gephyra]|uniref:Imm49 family immunity protein n=1 Tax=Archangium gephyra TaxID=48 RepID=UPI003B805024
MRSRFIPVILSNADVDLVRLVPALQKGEPVGWAFARACRDYRARGCAAFFLTGRPDSLHLDLQRSGAAHASFFARAPEAEKVTSRADPFFDAVACGDRAAAERIARHSPSAPKLDQEHLEDFLYVRFLMERFFLGATEEASERLLGQLEEAAGEGAPSARARVGHALFTGNAEAFRDSLLGLIGEHRAWYETGLQRGRIPEEQWATEAHLFVEGLALVRLARGMGMATDEEYPLIPSLALTTPRLAYDAEAWRSP